MHFQSFNFYIWQERDKQAI